MDEAKVKELESELAKLRASLEETANTHKTEVEKLTKELEVVKTSASTATEAHANCDATVKELTERAEKAEGQVEKMLKEYRVASRSSKIKELFTLSDEQYKKLMDVAAEYTDEEFGVWIANLIEVSKAFKRPEPEAPKTEPSDKGNAVASVLDGADKARITAGSGSGEKDKAVVTAKFLIGRKQDAE